MSSLALLACLIVLPALLTFGLVRLFLAHNGSLSRSQVLRKAVPIGAILPLLPVTWLVASATNIDNPVPIAIVATLLMAGIVGFCVCLPIGWMATQHIAR
jgi:hypothetical protein